MKKRNVISIYNFIAKFAINKGKVGLDVLIVFIHIFMAQIHHSQCFLRVLLLHHRYQCESNLN